MLAWFGVPFAAIGLLMLAYRLMPLSVWKSWPVQTFVTLAFLAAIAAPIAITWIDAQGDYFDDRNDLVRGGLSTPVEAEVAKQRFNSLGNCWSNGVNWNVKVDFGSAENLKGWYQREPWQQSLPDQISAYFGVPRGRVTIEEGALSPAMRDEKWIWDEQGRIPDWISRTYGYITPFVCTAIDGEAGQDGKITLRRCDPIALPKDTGNLGRVTITREDKPGILQGHIHYLGGPTYCTNPLRRGLNDLLGLPHPPAEVDSNIGSAFQL